MINLIRLIKAGWLKIRIPKRFYQYGTLGLSVSDNRSAPEKISDKIDEILDNLEKRYKERKRVSRQIWHTYWDICSKSYISSMADIKKIEKDRGWISMKPSDISKEAARARKDGELKSKRETKEYLNKCIKEINQGRSFIKEQRERRRSGKDNLGDVRAFN